MPLHTRRLGALGVDVQGIGVQVGVGGIGVQVGAGVQVGR